MAVPAFAKRKIRLTDLSEMNRLLSGMRLNTVCNEAQCPNRGECFASGHATFLIMGDVCTRTCTFCAIKTGKPQPLDPDEPQRIAMAASKLRLRHVVITSVNRDGLPDQGASHFAATIIAVRKALPQATIEVLIPDFKGSVSCLQTVCDARPDVLNHNMETVQRLYAHVRPQARYERSLELLRRVKEQFPGMLTKSGFMLGLGETDDEVRMLITDLAQKHLDILTIGQYLQPTKENADVVRYYTPDEYAPMREFASAQGIPHTFAGPHVRSSYMAHSVLEELSTKKERTK